MTDTRAPDSTRSGQEDDAAALSRQIVKLEKINRVLMDRAERDLAAQGNEYSLFQTAVVLDELIRDRTAELLQLNEHLRQEIAQRKDAEDALRAATREAERANQGKTRFFTAVSHDLHQPLSAAKLFLAALSESDQSTRNAGLIENIGRTLDSMEALLDSVLDISRLDSGRITCTLTTFEIGDLLRQLAAEYGIQCAKSGLSLRAVDCRQAVRSDRHLVERILRNYLSNAIRYTPAGRILMGCRRTSNGLRVEVWDQGRGIPEDQLASVFQEFHQLPNTVQTRDKGLGLGLAIVDRIARILGARVAVRSTVGRGSMFGLELPGGASSAPSDAPTAPASPLAQSRLVGSTVAVIDNDPNVLEGMASLLESWDCSPVTAVSGADAASFFADPAKAPEIVIADYHLDGGEKGPDAARAVEESVGRALPTIIVTSDPSREIEDAVRAAGHWFIRKPIKPARLRALLNHLLD